jgi:hypothetical protein
MSTPEEIARFNGLIETFKASTAALEKDFAIGQRALLDRALKAEATVERMCGEMGTLYAEIATLRGIIARSTIQRLSDGETIHITFDDLNASLEIAAAYKEANNLP